MDTGTAPLMQYQCAECGIYTAPAPADTPTAETVPEYVEGCWLVD
jgi:hypothetical protein